MRRVGGRRGFSGLPPSKYTSWPLENHFMDVLTEGPAQVGIFKARPKNLSEALQAALETKNFHKVKIGENQPRFVRVTDRDVEAGI